MTWILIGAGVALALALLYWLGGRPPTSRREDPRDLLDSIPPPPPPGPIRVMRMQTSGLVRVDEASGASHEEPLPASPYRAGEFPTAGCGADDGSIFVVGKLYTGRPGPDHGVLYQRDPGGAWRIAAIVEEHTFHSVACRGGDLVIGALGGVVRWDGSAASYTELSPGSVCKVWLEEGEIYVQTWDSKAAYRARGDRLEPTNGSRAVPEPACTISVDGVRYTFLDRSIELGEDDLVGDEAEELRRDLKALRSAVASGTARVSRSSSDAG